MTPLYFFHKVAGLRIYWLPYVTLWKLIRHADRLSLLLNFVVHSK